MPTTRQYPFRRLAVDNVVRGTSRVWWELENTFREPTPHVFQLQAGRTGLNTAVDWVNVGAPATGAFYALDSTPRDTGAVLLTHYRVALTTPTNTYVSDPVSCQGALDEKTLLTGREIIRKELLRHKMVSIQGFLLKRLRYGTKCTRCRDALTEEVTNSECQECNGTGFQVGYHAPAPLQCWDLSPQTFDERLDSQLKGSTRDNPIVQGRVIGFPMLHRHDIWVNGTSDERWAVHSVQVAAALRGVPLILNVRMYLAPLSHQVYRIEVGGEPADREGPVLPGTGSGSQTVDHDFGGSDNLAYYSQAGIPIVGATILAFTKSVYEAAAPGRPNASAAVATSSTMANGRWALAMQLNPGDYVLQFDKLGEYGPDTVEITVTCPTAESSSSVSVSTGSSSDFWDV